MTYVIAGVFRTGTRWQLTCHLQELHSGQMLTPLAPSWADELCVTFEVQRVILTLPTGRFVRGDEQFAIAGGHVDHAISCANGREKRPAFV